MYHLSAEHQSPLEASKLCIFSFDKLVGSKVESAVPEQRQAAVCFASEVLKSRKRRPFGFVGKGPRCIAKSKVTKGGPVVVEGVNVASIPCTW